jgi:hypothetical protein
MEISMAEPKIVEKELDDASPETGAQSSAEELPIAIRKAAPSDISFIFSSWLKSFRDSRFASAITTTIYYTEHHKVVERLLKTCDVYVACNPKDGTELFGYICAEKVDGILVVHYIYVKNTYRQLGLAKTLLNQFSHNPSAAAIFTHNTRASEKLASRFNFVYSPYLALTPNYRKEV